jgi:hypothetical protein
VNNDSSSSDSSDEEAGRNTTDGLMQSSTPAKKQQQSASSASCSSKQRQSGGSSNDQMQVRAEDNEHSESESNDDEDDSVKPVQFYRKVNYDTSDGVDNRKWRQENSILPISYDFIRKNRVEEVDSRGNATNSVTLRDEVNQTVRKVVPLPVKNFIIDNPEVPVTEEQVQTNIVTFISLTYNFIKLVDNANEEYKSVCSDFLRFMALSTDFELNGMSLVNIMEHLGKH